MAFDLDNLRVFLAAIDHGSFSAAAGALGRVPAAVSMPTAQLEAQVALPLFDRAGREPVPTAQARALVPQARRLAEQLGQLNRHALSMTQGLEPSLVIAVAPELVAATPWSDALATLSSEFPLLEIEVLTAPQADALAMLKSGRAQMALVFERQGLDPSEQFQEVARETLIAVAAASHPMLARDPAALRDEHLIAERQILVAGRDACDVDKRPSGFVRAALASGELVQIPAGNFTTALQLYVDVVWTQTRPLGLAARRFVELLNGRSGCSGPVAGDRAAAGATLSGSAPDPANPSAARPRAGKRRSSAASG